MVSSPKEQYFVRKLEAGVRAGKELAEERLLWRMEWKGVQE